MMGTGGAAAAKTRLEHNMEYQRRSDSGRVALRVCCASRNSSKDIISLVGTLRNITVTHIQVHHQPASGSESDSSTT